MNYIKKFWIAIGVALVACCMVVPLSNAQARFNSNALYINADGAFLGIQMKDVTSEDVSKYKLSGERGVIVSSVIKGSPAEAASIKENDVILEFGANSVWSSMQFQRLVQETPAGRNVDIVVSRDGKRMTLKAKLEAQEARRFENRMEMPPLYPMGPGNLRILPFRVPQGSATPGRVVPAAKPRLGVSIQPLSEQMGEYLGVPGKKGVLVASVEANSPSAGKIKAGDVIISVDGKGTENPEDLTRMIRDKPEGAVTLKVIRDKKEISVTVSLSAGEEKGYKL
jgi:serine protease Do